MMSEREREYRREAQKRYYREVIKASPERYAKYLQQARESRERHADKKAARNRIYRAVRDGKIVRPDACEGCGENKPLQGAHRDYAKPYDVRWLCSLCHGRYDRGMKERRV